MIETNFNKEEGILYVTTKGNVKINDMFNGIDLLANMTDLPEVLRIFDNAATSIAAFNVSDIELMVIKIRERLGKFKSIRHAVVHTDPLSTAYAVIARKKIEMFNYHLEVFSSEQAAIKWLKK